MYQMWAQEINKHDSVNSNLVTVQYFFAQGNHVNRSVTVQLQPLSDRFTRSHHSFQQQRHGRKARNVDIQTSIEK
jgi:hypothetical protein